MKKTIAFTLVAAALLTVVACGKAKDGGSVRGRNGRVGAVQPGGQPQAGQAGAIYANVSEQQFTQTIKSFLSSYVDPNDIGSVNPQGGATISGFIYYSCQTGQVNPQWSRIVITINDSYVQQGATPIVMNIPAVSGTITNYGSSVLRFGDELGQVTLQGQATTSSLNGQISWSNTQNVTGSTPTNGTLGQFQLGSSNFYCY